MVAENFPVAPSSNTRENISITVEEENYNLFEQLLTNNGQPQKNALWGFRMIEQFLTYLKPVFEKEMKTFLGPDALVNVKDINDSGDSYKRVMQK